MWVCVWMLVGLSAWGSECMGVPVVAVSSMGGLSVSSSQWVLWAPPLWVKQRKSGQHPARVCSEGPTRLRG